MLRSAARNYRTLYQRVDHAKASRLRLFCTTTPPTDPEKEEDNSAEENSADAAAQSVVADPKDPEAPPELPPPPDLSKVTARNWLRHLKEKVVEKEEEVNVKLSTIGTLWGASLFTSGLYCMGESFVHSSYYADLAAWYELNKVLAYGGFGSVLTLSGYGVLRPRKRIQKTKQSSSKPVDEKKEKESGRDDKLLKLFGLDSDPVSNEAMQSSSFDLRLLNDGPRFKKEERALMTVRPLNLVGERQLKWTWSKEKQQEVLQQVREQTAQSKKVSEEWLEAGMRAVEKALEDGMSENELNHRLNKTVWVIEWRDPPIPAADSRNSRSQPKKSTEHLLQDFAKQVSFILHVCNDYDEVVLRLTSPGGRVDQYGLAASQLVRLRNAGLKVTACVDSVAASGGYMMASVASQIVAAPFAYVGSIGVVSAFPNFAKLRKKAEVDYYEFTAGKFKRTVGMLKEPEAEHVEHFQDRLDKMHDAFKAHITTYRPSLSGEALSEELATGETWIGIEALENGLVDEVMTSDEYLDKFMEDYDVVEITPKPVKIKRGLLDVLGGLQAGAEDVGEGLSSVQRASEWVKGALGMRPGAAAFGDYADADHRTPVGRAFSSEARSDVHNSFHARARNL